MHCFARDMGTINGNAFFPVISEDGKTLLAQNIDKAGSINISGLVADAYYLKNNNTNPTKEISVMK